MNAGCSGYTANPVLSVTSPLMKPPGSVIAAMSELVGRDGGNSAAMRMLPAFAGVETGTADFGADFGFPVQVCAWNLQQMHFPEESLALLERARCDIILLSELDMGLHRTGQIESVRYLAARLGMSYAFAPEFFELPGRGPGIAAPDVCRDRIGYHGNAVLARGGLGDTETIHLDEAADWFSAPRTGRARVGRRVALAAQVTVASQDCLFVSVHLESDCGPEGRRAQARTLLKSIGAIAQGQPILVGGDFNAGAGTPRLDWRNETFFELFEAAGFAWSRFNGQWPTSRKSRVANAASQDVATYDWFFWRGFNGFFIGTIAAMDCRGQSISDHDAICIRLERS